MEERRFPSEVTWLRERAPLSRELSFRRSEDIVSSFRFEGSAGRGAG